MNLRNPFSIQTFTIVQRIFHVERTIGSSMSDREINQWLLYVSSALELPTNHRLRRWQCLLSSRTSHENKRKGGNRPACSIQERFVVPFVFINRPLFSLRVSMDHRVFCVLVVCMLRSACARSDVLELKDSDFDYLAPEHETLLVKFYAPWWETINPFTHQYVHI